MATKKQVVPSRRTLAPEEVAARKKLVQLGVATTVEQYKAVLAARKEAFAAHVSQPGFADPALHAWAARMAMRANSKTVKVYHNELPWLEALMVVRYGEAIDFWPDHTSIADYGRAMDWESGKEIPEAFIRGRVMNLSGKE